MTTSTETMFNNNLFTIVGSPTVTSDGVASNFSTTSYLTQSLSTEIELNKIFIVEGEFTTGTSFSAEQTIFSLKNTKTDLTSAFDFVIDKNGIINYTTNGFATGLTTLVANTTYYFKLQFNGSNSIFCYLGTTKTDLILDATVSILPTNNLNIMYIGIDSTLTKPLIDGTLNLKHFAVSIDGTTIFKGEEYFVVPNRAVFNTIVASKPINENWELIQSALNKTFTKADAAENYVVSIDDTISEKISVTEKGANGGVATLDSNGKIPTSQIPTSAKVNVYTVGSEMEQTSLIAYAGDICIREDLEKTYILQGSDPSDMGDWLQIASMDTGGEIGSNPAFKVEFDETSWELGGSNYYLDYTVDEHCQGANSHLLVLVKNTDGENINASYKVDDDGTVYITSDEPFAGEITISNLEGNLDNTNYTPYSVFMGAVKDGKPDILRVTGSSVTLNCDTTIYLVDGMNIIREITDCGNVEVPTAEGIYYLFVDSANIDNKKLSKLTVIAEGNYFGIVDEFPNMAANDQRCYVPNRGSFSRTGTGWKRKGFTPVGKVIVKNNTIHDTITYDYNQNGMNVNYKSHSLDHLFGNQIQGLSYNVNDNVLTIQAGKCLANGRIIENTDYIVKDCLNEWEEGDEKGAISTEYFEAPYRIVYSVLKDGTEYFVDTYGDANTYVKKGLYVYKNDALTERDEIAGDLEYMYSGASSYVYGTADGWCNVYLISDGNVIDALITKNEITDTPELGFEYYRRIGYIYLNSDGTVRNCYFADNTLYIEAETTTGVLPATTILDLPVDNCEVKLNYEVTLQEVITVTTNNFTVHRSNNTIETINFTAIGKDVTINGTEGNNYTLQLLAIKDLRNDG